MANLYSLTSDYMKIQEMIEDGAEGLEDTLESIDSAIEDKLENIGKVMKNIDGEVDAIKAEEKRLADKRKSLENDKKRLKEYAEGCMVAADKRKVKTPLFSFNIQKGPQHVHIIDQRQIPKWFYEEVEPRLNKKLLLERMKNGEYINGVRLEQNESLRIR